MERPSNDSNLKYSRFCSTKYIATRKVWVSGLPPRRRTTLQGMPFTQRVFTLEANRIKAVVQNKEEHRSRIKYDRFIRTFGGGQHEISYEYIHPNSPLYQGVSLIHCFFVLQDNDDLA